MTTVPEMAREIVEACDAESVPARLLGGVAVHHRCPSARHEPLARNYDDIDLVTRMRSTRPLTQVLVSLGYAPSERFNALHGHVRLLFDHSGGPHIDVLVDRLSMCHVLDLRRRLDVGADTLPLADLLLTKLQIAQVNRKDVVDTAALLLDHDYTSDDSGINLPYMLDLLRADWGWWRTASETLEAVASNLGAVGLDPESEARVRERLERLNAGAAKCPKTARWKARAIVGEKMRWREDPEEIVT